MKSENANTFLEAALKKILSPNIRLLGDILGEVLLEQEGKENYEIEEQVRKLAKEFREKNSKQSFQELKSQIASVTRPQEIVLIKAFSQYFRLVNLAEEYYKVHVSKLKEFERKTSSFNYAINFAIGKNISKEDLLALIGKLNIRLVWTAHPTEARRLTVLMKLREIYRLLTQMQGLDPYSYGYQQLRLKIKEQVTILWQTDELRENKATLLDEVRTVLFYFDNTLFDLIPEIYGYLEQEYRQQYHIEDNIQIDLPQILEFGSWVGGDRDGHPGVTANVTIQTLLLHKRLCVRKYLEKIEVLIQHLSISSKMIGVSDDLFQSIKEDGQQFTEFEERTRRLNISEPYRKKLDFIRLKLQNTLEDVDRTAVDVGLGQTLVGASASGGREVSGKFYTRSTEFMNDLLILQTSLFENRGTVIATGKLKDLIRQVEIFGFHLAPLDLRQDSSYHFDVLTEIFSIIGLEDLQGLSYELQAKIFLRELKNPRPLGLESIYDELSARGKELFMTLKVAYDSVSRISPRSLSTYIISMAHHERDVYGLMLLMREVGLLKIHNGLVTEAFMDIAPLFETRVDLDNSADVMERLYEEPLYASLLEIRKNIQEIMIGYSDSSKDAGILDSNYRLVVAQDKFVKVSNKHKVQLRIFHGRGGSVSRGGGPTNQALLALPPKTVTTVKITEQGEVIGQNYSNKEIAQSHLEGILSAMIVRGITDELLPMSENPAAIEEPYLKQFEQVAVDARERYEAMVKNNPEFIKFYMSYTPLDLIERATIGSRPSRRTTSGVSSISGLRAIPWVFSWMQCRAIFTGYFGVGTALSNQQGNFEILKEMYQKWPFFQAIINNIQMVMLKADMDIAKQYLQVANSEEREKLFEVIKQEYELTKSLLMDLTDSKGLLNYAPDIQTSILRRNPYIDPLNLIQVKLLQEWRKKGRPEEMIENSLLRLLLQTVNGIAAGLKNTG